ncbi:MAG: hypothetical protein P9M14_07170 [Candidatus Alcyoniella australis]|nr:hypothetical protein [Candidatus Alcyoniella australis]
MPARIAERLRSAPNWVREALTWLFPLLLFIKVRLDVIYRSDLLLHGEEELFQGLLGHHLIHGRLAPFIVYQHSQDAGGTLHTGLLSYIPFSFLDPTYVTLKLVPLGVGVLILLAWMLLARLAWGRIGALIFGVLLAVLPDYLLRRGLFAFGNHHDLNLLIGLMYLSFFAMVSSGPGRLRQPLFAALFGLSLGYALYIDLSVLPFLPLFAVMFWTVGLRRIRLISYLAMIVAWRVGFHLWYASHTSHNFIHYLRTFMSQGVPWGVEDNPQAQWTLASLGEVTRFSSSGTANALFLLWLGASCALVIWFNRFRVADAIKALSPLPRHKLAEPLDWRELAFAASVISFALSFLIFTRGQAGNPDLIRYWTALYTTMIVCQTQGLLLLIRHRLRWVSRSGMILAGVMALLMYNAIPEVHFDQDTSEDMLVPGYSYFYFTGNLLAHYEMPIDQALFSDLNVGGFFSGQKAFLEGVAIGVGALTGFDAQGHFELARGYQREKQRRVFEGIGFAHSLCVMKWRNPQGELPPLSPEEQQWVRWGEKRFIEQLGRAKLIDRTRDRLKDAYYLVQTPQQASEE